MKKRLFGFVGLSFLLGIFVLAVAPARAQNVDEKIKNLEQELSDLKSQQIEMKKDAAAAAAALPNFSYRPGNGALIEAADKSWGLRFSLESHFRLEFLSGRPQAGRTSGEIMGRRFRPYINYCLQDCLYEMEMGLDLDGWDTNSALQRGVDAVGDKMKRRASAHVHRRARMMREHENRRVVRRVVTPPAFPLVIRPCATNWSEHIAAQNPRADALRSALRKIVVNTSRAFVLALHLLKRARWNEPLMKVFAANAQLLALQRKQARPRRARKR